MKVTVKLFASLRVGRFDIREIELAEGSSLADLVARVGVDPKEAAVVFKNARHAGFEEVLAEGDVVGIFPPVGGG